MPENLLAHVLWKAYWLTCAGTFAFKKCWLTHHHAEPALGHTDAHERCSQCMDKCVPSLNDIFDMLPDIYCITFLFGGRMECQACMTPGEICHVWHVGAASPPLGYGGAVRQVEEKRAAMSCRAVTKASVGSDSENRGGGVRGCGLRYCW